MCSFLVVCVKIFKKFSRTSCKLRVVSQECYSLVCGKVAVIFFQELQDFISFFVTLHFADKMFAAVGYEINIFSRLYERCKY